MPGYSESIMCLEEVTDTIAQAIVFQNFQMPLKAEPVVEDYRPKLDDDETRIVQKWFFAIRED